MDTPTFLDLAHALREESAVALQAIARMSDVDAEHLAALRMRAERVAASAKLFTGLAPQERLVRAMIDVGALPDFPAYSADITALRSGDVVLLRGQVCDVFPGECQVAFAAQRASTRFLIARDDIVAIERVTPTMWKAQR